LNTAWPAVFTSASRRPKRLHLARRRLDLIGQGDVAGQRERAVRLAQRRDRAGQRLPIDIEQRHTKALGKEALGGGEPDAARGAGDQRNPVSHSALSVRMSRPRASCK